MNRLASTAARSLRASSTPRLTLTRLSPIAVRHSSNEAESFQDFSKRYTSFFENAEDLFELQRGLNNCFAYDLVPGTDVIEAALRASRRLDTYSTAVRILEGVKEKVENPKQYEAYLGELKDIRAELGMLLHSWDKASVNNDPLQGSVRRRSFTPNRRFTLDWG